MRKFCYIMLLAIVALLYFLVLPYVLGNFDERIDRFFKYFITLLVLIAACPAGIKAVQNRRQRGNNR